MFVYVTFSCTHSYVYVMLRVRVPFLRYFTFYVYVVLRVILFAPTFVHMYAYVYVYVRVLLFVYVRSRWCLCLRFCSSLALTMSFKTIAMICCLLPASLPAATRAKKDTQGYHKVQKSLSPEERNKSHPPHVFPWLRAVKQSAEVGREKLDPSDPDQALITR